MTNEIKPLTPKFRAEINEGIDKALREFDDCQSTVYISAIRIGLNTWRNIINSLPDGYPIPVKRGES